MPSLADRRKRQRSLHGCLPTLGRNGARRPSPAFLGRGVLGLTTTPHGNGAALLHKRSSCVQSRALPVRRYDPPPFQVSEWTMVRGKNGYSGVFCRHGTCQCSLLVDMGPLLDPVPVTMDILVREGRGGAETTRPDPLPSTRNHDRGHHLWWKPTRLAHLSNRRMKLCYPRRHVSPPSNRADLSATAISLPRRGRLAGNTRSRGHGWDGRVRGSATTVVPGRLSSGW